MPFLTGNKKQFQPFVAKRLYHTFSVALRGTGGKIGFVIGFRTSGHVFIVLAYPSHYYEYLTNQKPETAMKNHLPAALMAAVTICFSTGSFADADDVKWINKCMVDNKDEGAKESVVRKYCECMNDKMDSNETLSISQWEKTHPKEMKECSAKAGWK